MQKVTLINNFLIILTVEGKNPESIKLVCKNVVHLSRIPAPLPPCSNNVALDTKQAVD